MVGPSPLTLRILAINVVALAALVGGVLYLDRFETGLVETRMAALMTQGEIIAGALAEAATAGPEAAHMEVDMSRQILQRLVVPTGTRARLYDSDGALLADSRDLLAAQQVLTSSLDPPGGLAARLRFFTRPFGWRSGGSIGRWQLADYRESSPHTIAGYAEAEAALLGAAGGRVRLAVEGNLMLSAAVPVQRLKRVLGVLLLTVEDRGIEQAVRDQHAAILAIFAVALGATVMLSLYLGRTIARPVRQLARAAERVRQGLSRRVPIPDFSHRRDEIGDLSAALGDMTRTLYERLDAIETFAADVAHEIKNPLTSLRSAVETVARTKNPAQQKELLDIIQDDVRRLDRLISDISDASRLDAELSRAEFEPVNLGDLCESLAEIYRARPRSDGAARPRLVLDLADREKLIVEGMEGRLGQVAQNLLDNAVSFSPANSTIRLAARREGSWVVLTIDDEGPGLPADRLEAVFERFYSARPSAETFGLHSGLGLSIARQIILAHGGTISAENREQDGTGPGGARFVVRLPA